MASDSKRPPAAAQKPRAVSHKSSGFSLSSDQSARYLLIGASALVVALAIGLVAFGWYWTEYRPRFRTVLQVEDEKVSFAAMKRRMEYEYFVNVSYQQSPQLLPTVAYGNLIEEKLLLTHAESDLGITLDPSEENAKLRQRIGVPADASDEDFGERYKSVLASSGLTDGEYRNVARAEVLKEKVLSKYTVETPGTIDQARIEVILTEDEPAAQAAIARINAGEDWATVAKEVSKEADVQTTGGLKEYQPQGAFPSAYDAYAFSGGVGAVSAPLRASDTEWYVVRVIDRSPQPLSDDQKNDYARRQYEQWLDDTQAAANIKDNWSSDTDAQVEAVTPFLGRAVQPPQQPQPIATISAPTLVPTTAPPADGQ